MNHKFREVSCIDILYTKAQSGEQSERTVIPVALPQTNFKALDVTSLSDEDRAELVELYNQYQGYVANHIARLFNFEDFISHTTGEDRDVKWRTFKTENVEPLD